MHSELIEKNPVLKHSFELALMVIDYCEMLQEQKRFVISNQLMKSGTSVGANIMEAQNAESKADFIHKMKSQPKKLKKHNTGLHYANIQASILLAIYYLTIWMKSTGF
jgi:four helix bundle protein